MGISQLGYIGIATSNIDAWLSVVTTVLGAQVRPAEASDGTRHLRFDERHHRIALHPGEKDDVLYVGWQVETPSELDALTQNLATAGAKPEIGTPADCRARGVHQLVRFTDPEGYTNELFTRPLIDAAPFNPSLPIAGFKTGALGLGHVVRHCKHHARMLAFYCGELGFRVSDQILWADMDASFLRCNARHHSLALLNESIGHVGGQTNHIMVEMESLADVGRAYDAVLRQRLPIIMTLGQHGNDMTTSFYFVGPSGFGIEVGCGALLVDETSWSVKTYNATKIWGHHLPHERTWETPA
jgi:2,3-dihydroxybiphenyl 1,2-dioxygenase